MLGKKSPKSEKKNIYISFKPHLIHHTAQVNAKMRCGAVMVFAKSKPHHTTHVTAKMRYGVVIVLPKPHCKVRC